LSSSKYNKLYSVRVVDDDDAGSAAEIVFLLCKLL
jgi:hypothetical protein